MEQKPLFATHFIPLKRVFRKEDLRYWALLWLSLISIFSFLFFTLFSYSQKELDRLNEISIQIALIDAAFHQKAYLPSTTKEISLLNRYKESLVTHQNLFPSIKPWQEKLNQWSSIQNPTSFHLTLDELPSLTDYLEKECYLFSEKGIDYHYSLIQSLNVTQQATHRYKAEVQMLQGTLHADLS